MRAVAAVLLAAVVAGIFAAGPAAGQAAGVKVIVNGLEVPLAAPAVLANGAVMAPLPGLFEPLGAAAAFYETDRSIVVTNRVRTTVRMRLGQLTAFVDGRPRALPAAPALVGPHVFIPVQAVFAALGAWTAFDEDERVLHVASQITGVSATSSGGGLEVRVEATGPVQVETHVLTGPDRLVVDFRHAALRVGARELRAGDAGVTRIRMGQFQVKPYVTRMVFDLAQAVEIRVATSPTSYLVTLEVRPRGPAAAPAPPPPTAGPEREPYAHPPGAAKITAVAFEPTAQGGRLIVIGEGTLQYRVREFVFPDRLAIDIDNAVFIPVRQEIGISGASIAVVRAAQFTAEPPVTRVVVTLKRKMNYVVSQADGRLILEIVPFAARGHVVAVDPGHGGRDPGAIGPTGLREAEVVLDIALRVRELLARDGVRVVLTRDRDVTVELTERPRIAREAGATIFVSIHANAHARTAVNGSETYYLTPQSLALAQMIQDELGIVLGIPSRGIKTANFLVLRDTAVPSVLVEVAFISHADDEARLRDPAFRQRIAAAIHRGIARFVAIYPIPAQP